MVGQHPTSNAVSSAQATNMVPNFPGDEICVEHHPTSKAVSTPPTNMVPLLPGVEMWDDETRDAIFLDKLLDDKMWDDKMWDGKMFDDTLPFDKLWGEDAVPPETTNMVPLLAGDETMVEHHPTPSAVFGAVTMNMVPLPDLLCLCIGLSLNVQFKMLLNNLD